MSFLSNRFIAAVTIGVLAFSAANAATNPQINVRPQARIVNKVDNSKVVSLANTHPAIADHAVDNGRVSASTPTGNLMLVLKGSDVQEAALQSLLDEQQDKGSPNFHQWMTPEAFGAAFGVASSDLAQVSAWLQDQGFKVAAIGKGGRVIQFSGNTGQLEKAFHTEMHHVTVNGESHVVSTVDLSVPEALAPVMTGIATLSDFHKTSAGIVNPRKLVLGSDGQMHPVIPGTDSPDYTSVSSGSHYVGPGDFSTIYNAKPLVASGIDGTGVTIGVLGQSTISLSNVETFRSMFLLPDNDPTIINVGPAPAIIGDDIESDLDVEWAGAIATKAKVLFYTAGLGGGFYDDGIDVSVLTAVDTNVADIITLSYGGCEVSNGAAGTAYWNGLWEQAAAQGQTVFVSTGDSSATTCASSSAALAGTTGNASTYAVNALGSSAYNVAVGGTGFNEGATSGQTGVTPYWSVGGIQPYGTAISYIPETVYSEGVFDVVIPGTGIAGGGGGVSIYTGRPAWQVGPGISPTADPAGPTFTAAGAIPASQLHRLVPDLSLIAAGGHDGTIFCSEGVCKLNPDGTIAGIGVVGGTSVATPTMAGVQALINQKNGGRQGNANYYYYKLAAAQTTANCASTLPPAATCNFNDIVSGNNYSPKTNTAHYNIATGVITGTLGTDYIGFPAVTGFDPATGLGTPNITNIANNWKSVTFNASKTTLGLTPTSITHGAAQTAVITVAAVSGSGTPTGDVSIIAVGQPAGSSDGNYYKLVNGTVTVTLKNLPGGTYNVVARYGGDSVYGASDSAPVQVTIAKEPSETFLEVSTINTTQGQVDVTSFVYGTSTYLVTYEQGASASAVNGNNILNTGVPTGSITYTLVVGGVTLPTYVSPLDAYGTAYLEAGPAVGGYLLPSTYPTLTPGAYTATVSYPGDNSFGASSASSPFTVTKASVNPAIRVLTADIISGATATFNVTIAASGAGALPTGTVTLTDTTTSTALGTGTLVNGAVLFNTTAIKTAGAHTISAVYSGDSNYNTTTSANATITVTTGTGSAVVLTPSLTTAPVLTSISFATTVPALATGTVTFYDQSIYLGSVNISASTHLAPNLALATLTAGVHNITAAYSGNATQAAATSAPVTVTITQNQPTLALTSQQQTSNSLTFNMNGVLTLVPTAATPVPYPSGSINFMDGTTVLGSSVPVKTLNYGFFTAAFTAPNLTKPGIHTLTAVYPGDANYAAATSNTQTVSIGLTTIALTVPTTVGTGIPFTITGKITPNVPNTPAIGGTVTFTDSTTNTVLGTATVVAGTATLTTATVTTVGTHTITAVYSGDSNYYTSSTTAAVGLSAVTPGFSISVNPTSLTITRGQSGVIALTATTYGGYQGFGLTTLSGLPANASYIITNSPYVFSAPTNGLGTTTQTFNVYITTFTPHASVKPASFLWLPALLLAGLLALRRKQFSARGRQLVVFAILMFGMLAVTGCGSSGSFAGTATGTTNATVTMVGTGSTAASPNMTATASFSVTVQ